MTDVPAPYALLAELTHRCPLHCVYCSNPLELQQQSDELSTEEWLRILREAHELGIVQVHLSGGEPLLRPDLEDIVQRARQLAIFTHLVTSGVGLTQERSLGLASAGLNSVQLSVQAATARRSDMIAGRKAYDDKRRAADAIREARLPLTLNVVLHRHNLDELDEVIDLALAWGAQRLELANTQYYSWALVNRDRLLPIRDQLARAEALYHRRKAALHGRLEMVWVLSDYHEPHPKPCMGGWGRLALTVSPNGTVLPCPVASAIAHLHFDTVRQRSLAWIWQESASFNAYRGFDWMPEPCRSCDRRTQDFGGCRCQAFALTGDAGRTDPVCQWSPDHHLVETAVIGSYSEDDLPADRTRAASHRLMYRKPSPSGPDHRRHNAGTASAAAAERLPSPAHAVE